MADLLAGLLAVDECMVNYRLINQSFNLFAERKIEVQRGELEANCRTGIARRCVSVATLLS